SSGLGERDPRPAMLSPAAVVIQVTPGLSGRCRAFRTGLRRTPAMRTKGSGLLTLLVLAAARTASPQTAVINVDATADQHAINPAVYGLAYATPAQLQDLRMAGNRRGGKKH